MLATVTVPEAVLQSLIAGVVTLTLAYMQHRTNISVRRASDLASAATQQAAVAVREVKDTVKVASAHAVTAAAQVHSVAAKTDKKLDEISKTATDTHTLVNSNMAVQLKLHAVTARRLSEITKDPVDIKAAELAEQLVSEHETKQDLVDTRGV